MVAQNANYGTTSRALTGIDSMYYKHDNRTLGIWMSSADIDYVKSQNSLFYDIGTTWLTMKSEFIKDTVKLSSSWLGPNPVQAIADGSALQARRYSPDVTSPELVSYIVDMAEAKITLTFNEPVRAGVLDAGKITLQVSDVI